MDRQTLTPEMRAIAAGIAVAHPLRNAAVAVNRGPAEPVHAPHTFDAAIEAIEGGADRVEAQRIEADLSRLRNWKADRARDEAELLRRDLDARRNRGEPLL